MQLMKLNVFPVIILASWYYSQTLIFWNASSFGKYLNNLRKSKLYIIKYNLHCWCDSFVFKLTWNPFIKSKLLKFKVHKIDVWLCYRKLKFFPKFHSLKNTQKPHGPKVEYSSFVLWWLSNVITVNSLNIKITKYIRMFYAVLGSSSVAGSSLAEQSNLCSHRVLNFLYFKPQWQASSQHVT